MRDFSGVILSGVFDVPALGTYRVIFLATWRLIQIDNYANLTKPGHDFRAAIVFALQHSVNAFPECHKSARFKIKAENESRIRSFEKAWIKDEASFN